MRTKTILTTVALLVGATFLFAGSASAFHDTTDVFRNFEICDIDGTRGLGSILDVSTESTVRESTSRDVRLDEDNVFLGIALARNNFGRLSFNDLADIDLRSDVRVTFDQDVDIDRDDVLTGLALGIGRIGSSNALACAADRSIDSRVTTDVQQSVDLDEDTTLLAIALGNSLRTPISFDDILNRDRSYSRTVTFDSDSDIDRDTALWLIALG